VFPLTNMMPRTMPWTEAAKAREMTHTHAANAAADDGESVSLLRNNQTTFKWQAKTMVKMIFVNSLRREMPHHTIGTIYTHDALDRGSKSKGDDPNARC
jgi:hypothetical protein